MERIIDFIKKYKWGIVWVVLHIMLFVFGEGEDYSGFWPVFFDRSAGIFKIDFSPRVYDLGEFLVYVIILPVVLILCRSDN